MATPVDPVLSHHLSQESQPAAVPELPNDQPHQPPKQRHAEDHTKQIEATSGENHCQRQARHLPCLLRLQEGLRQGLTCSFVGNHEEVQQQRQPYPSLQKPV